MSDSKLDFSKARPGDVLWSDKYGDVTFRSYHSETPNPVLCIAKRREALGGEVSVVWKKDGRFYASDATNDLHWSRPVFEEPHPPKRMAKMNIEKTIHVTKWALRIQPKHQKCPCGCIHHFDISHEFEVEVEE